EIGNGGAGPSDRPLDVTATYAPASPVKLSVGSAGEGMCAIMQSSNADWCWGYRTPTGYSSVPVQYTGQAFTQVAFGTNQTCALDASGKAYCWGSNYYGGTGQPIGSTFTTTPTAVPTSMVFSTIVSGSRFTCAVAPTGIPLLSHTYCWGENG